MKLEMDLRDLNRSALERLVKQLLSADSADDKEIMDKLAEEARKESEDLADLKEEKSGKPSPVDMDAEPTRRKKDV